MSRAMGRIANRHDRLLRRSLTANAAFSGASGGVLAGAAGPVAAFLGWAGPPAPAVLFGIGIALLAFATLLVSTARAARPNEVVVRGIVAMDAAWVVGSALLLALGLAPSGQGAAVIGGVATVVALLAAGQALGLARMRRANDRPESSR